MKASLKMGGNMRIVGTNELGLKTEFDSHPASGGTDSAPTPMEIVLQALAACSFMDIVSVIRKKRKEVTDFDIVITGERADKHPKVFSEIHIKYILTSPDATQKELDRAVELSQETYCGVSAMIKAGGCKVTWENEVKKP